MLSPPPRLTSPQCRGGRWKGFLEEGGRREEEEEEEEEEAKVVGDKSKANFSSGQFLNDDNFIFSGWREVEVLMCELLPDVPCPHSPSLISLSTLLLFFFYSLLPLTVLLFLLPFSF